MSLTFRRKATPESLSNLDGADADAGVTVVTPQPRSLTPSKKELGKVTPKRSQAGRRVMEPPPANRREAMKRARIKQREARAETRAGMLAGKEEFLMPRDKGPQRSLVRDVVDARRNIASFFLPSALIVILGSSQAMPPEVQLGSNIAWAMVALAVIVDSFVLSRRVKRVIGARFGTDAGRHTGYAIMRSLSIRRLRMPAPQVKPGATI